MSSVLTNEIVLNYLDSNGKDKCIELIKSEDTSSFSPVHKSYQKCIERLVSKRKLLLKSKHSPTGLLKLNDFFLGKKNIFLKAQKS